jgi:hypothetical protein
VVRKAGQQGKTLAPEQAERLRREKVEKAQAGPAAEPFRDEILALLDSGGAREAGHATVAGRDALRITSADGRTTYVVDASTYDPIRLVTVNGGATTTLDFRVYEQLDAGAGGALVSLAARHAGAAVDASPEGYEAAQARLFPHG